MSDIAASRSKFVAALDGKIERSAAEVFDEGLRMAQDGTAVEDIKAFLHGAANARTGVGTFGDSGQCASQCQSDCSGYPDGPPWYACYAGCFAGCMSA